MQFVKIVRGRMPGVPQSLYVSDAQPKDELTDSADLTHPGPRFLVSTVDLGLVFLS